MISATPRVASAVVVAAALALTGACDSGGDGGAPETTRPSASDSSGTAPASRSPSVSVSPTPTGTAPEDPEKVEQEIREAWRVFFDPKSSLEERSEIVESGKQNVLMIDNLFRDPLGRRLRADVTSVSYTASEDATVAYTLTRDGRRLGSGGPGASVFQDDTWKIALRTVCSLTRHAEDAPEATSCG